MSAKSLLLRAQMQDKDTPARIKERLRQRAACEQACREREKRFPVLTAENAREALEWQERRIRTLLQVEK